MRLRSKSFLPSPVPSECSPSRAHPTSNTCSRIWPVPPLHSPLMRCAPSKVWSNSRERHLLQSSQHIASGKYALVDVSGRHFGRQKNGERRHYSTPADIAQRSAKVFVGGGESM